MQDPTTGTTPVVDELARQRTKRLLAMLDRPVVDDPTMTMRDVVDSVVRADAGSETALDVAAFLEGEGHSWRTIETVLAYLDADDRSRS